MISAAATLTFRRGAGGVGFLVSIATIGSGAYFPLTVLPVWIQELAAYNPVAIAVTAMRDALLGGATFVDVWPAVVRLIPMSALTMDPGRHRFPGRDRPRTSPRDARALLSVLLSSPRSRLLARDPLEERSLIFLRPRGGEDRPR